jgi:hypothetical protein
VKLAVIPLALASAAVVVFFATSHDDLHFACHLRLMPIRCVQAAEAESRPPAADEVRRVVEAAYRDQLDETIVHLYATVNHAQAAGKGTDKWAFEIEEGVPGLAQRVGDLTEPARARVAAVQVETTTGRRFRVIALQGLRLQGTLFDAFAGDLASRQPTLTAFNRWSTRLNALHRWYRARYRFVLVAAPPQDRGAVEAALRQY